MYELDISQIRMIYLIAMILKRGRYYLIDEVTTGLPGAVREDILSIIKNWMRKFCL